jgi:hypothetical protein
VKKFDRLNEFLNGKIGGKIIFFSHFPKVECGRFRTVKIVIISFVIKVNGQWTAKQNPDVAWVC